MRETERLMSIRGKMTVLEEIVRFDDAQSVVEAAFRSMLYGTAAYMRDDEKLSVDMGEASRALRFIGDCAKQVGMDFYDFPSEDSVRRYVLKFGIEVVTKREYEWDLRTPVENSDT